MDKFNNIKRIVTDKPEFHLADPNNPVRYVSKPAPSVGQEMQAPDVYQKMQNTLDESGRGHVADQESDKQQSSDMRRKQLMSSMAGMQQPNNHLDENGDDDGMPDDDKATSESINEIGNMDTGQALNEIYNLDKYDMTNRDRSYIWDQVMNTLRKSGRIK